MDGFPLSHADRTFAAALEELPVEVVVGLLLFAEQAGKEADSIESPGNLGSGQFAECREDIPVGGHMCTGGAGPDPARPANEERAADAALVEITLVAAEATT